jgi:hypothetical membrane protein
MKKTAPFAGLATCLVLYSVIIIAAIPYVGQQGETYSIFNHFISELGSTRFSVNHLIYNSGVIFAAIGFGLFTIGLLYYVKTNLVRVAVAIGVISSFFCMGVGLVPEEHRWAHLILAFSFFCLMTIASTLFSWSILKEKENPFPKYTAVHGFFITLFFTLFICMPKGLMAIKRTEGPFFARPEIWWLPFMEWLIFFALTSWIFIISIKMIQFQKKEAISEAGYSKDISVS